MSVVVIGLEHTTATLDLLERVVVPDAEISKVLAALAAHDNVREVAILSTCLRTEIYAVVDRFHDAVEEFTELFVANSGVSRETIEEHQMVFFDRGVASHLFRIASGLESVVPGESEVLGQVRRALERATQEGTAGTILTGLFTHAIATGRRVRVDTAIARGTTSFSYASVELAQRQLNGDLSGSTVVVLGAGALGAGTVTALIDERRSERPSEVIVINRTKETATAFVKTLDTSQSVRVAPIENLGQELKHARLLITAVEVEGPVVSEAHIGDRSESPLLVVDLGMPRNVALDATKRYGVDILDISHLQSVVDQAVRERQDEITAAEAIVVEEVSRYEENLRGRGAAPLVVALREHLEELRRSEIDRRSSDFADLTPEQREAVEALTRSLLAKVAHDPTVALKESVGTSRGERLVEAARIFFKL